MKKRFIYIAALLTCGCFYNTKSYAESPRPNVVVVLADDLGFGDVSSYGSTTIQTPNIDSLAINGLRLNNGYASSATSTPSRYALMTGMYPWKNDEAKILDGDAPLIINESGYTLPKMMKEAGYKTGAIGKWHLGMGRGKVDWNAPITPGAREVGFDYSCIAAATNDRVPTVFVENGSVLNQNPTDPIYVDYERPFPGEPTATGNPELIRMPYSHGHNNAVINGIPRIGYMTGGKEAIWDDEALADFYISRVKDFLVENADTSFFLYYGLHQPHVPRTPHPRFAGLSGMGPRGDAILEADWCVGELVATLDSLKLLENTMIVFTSDNGAVLNDGYRDGAEEMVGSHDPNGGLRGGKYSLFDGGAHVPFSIYWKGQIAPRTTDALFTQMDLAATIADLIGATINADIDSRSFLPLLFDEAPGRDALIVEASGRLALRTPRWILIPPYKGSERNLTGNELGNVADYALYEVETDPGQLHDVSAANPEVLEELKALFATLTAGYYNPDTEELQLK